MSFEEDFPGLAKTGILTVDGIPEIEFIPIALVDKHCLDKKKILEAMEQGEQMCGTLTGGKVFIDKEGLKKRLGLK